MVKSVELIGLEEIMDCGNVCIAVRYAIQQNKHMYSMLVLGDRVIELLYRERDYKKTLICYSETETSNLNVYSLDCEHLVSSLFKAIDRYEKKIEKIGGKKMKLKEVLDRLRKDEVVDYNNFYKYRRRVKAYFLYKKEYAVQEIIGNALVIYYLTDDITPEIEKGLELGFISIALVSEIE